MPVSPLQRQPGGSCEHACRQKESARLSALCNASLAAAVNMHAGCCAERR